MYTLIAVILAVTAFCLVIKMNSGVKVGSIYIHKGTGQKAIVTDVKHDCIYCCFEGSQVEYGLYLPDFLDEFKSV